MLQSQELLPYSCENGYLVISHMPLLLLHSSWGPGAHAPLIMLHNTHALRRSQGILGSIFSCVLKVMKFLTKSCSKLNLCIYTLRKQHFNVSLIVSPEFHIHTHKLQHVGNFEIQLISRICSTHRGFDLSRSTSSEAELCFQMPPEHNGPRGRYAI